MSATILWILKVNRLVTEFGVQDSNLITFIQSTCLRKDYSVQVFVIDVVEQFIEKISNFTK